MLYNYIQLLVFLKKYLVWLIFFLRDIKYQHQYTIQDNIIKYLMYFEKTLRFAPSNTHLNIQLRWNNKGGPKSDMPRKTLDSQ